MKKIILSKDYSGFQVSKKGYELYIKKAKEKGLEHFIYKHKFKSDRYILKKTNNKNAGLFVSYFTKDFGDNAEITEKDYEKYILNLSEELREDETFIEVVEELGQKASEIYGKLIVVEIPDNVFYVIDGCDGLETLYYSKSEILEK